MKIMMTTMMKIMIVSLLTRRVCAQCSGPPDEHSHLCEKLCDTPEDLDEYSAICGFDDDDDAME